MVVLLLAPVYIYNTEIILKLTSVKIYVYICMYVFIQYVRMAF